MEFVPVRSAWSHEAHSLTPWLAANLDRLGDTLSLSLELEGTELRVGTFAADIIARDVQSGERILIENQLEVSDHTHLGQILTYLAGLEAHIIVWIAPEFREPHLSAIRWLNEHTEEPFAFFAVRLQVARIADSPLAPVFDVLERPNKWDRQVRDVARDSADLSELAQRRREFWTLYFARHPDRNPTGGAAPAASAVWAPVAGHPLIVAQYVGKESVGLFVRAPRGGDKDAARHYLIGADHGLEVALGVPIGEPGSIYLFTDSLPIDTLEASNWPRAADWLAERTRLYLDMLARLPQSNFKPDTA